MLHTKFAIPDVIFGQGSIRHVGQCARRLGAKRVFFVSDSGLEDIGWVQHVIDLLEADNLECVYFNKVMPNPRDSHVHEGAEIYTREACDVILALGGGSPMDEAKGIGLIVGNGGHIREYEGANKVQRPLPPMIFIPSTAGSGSDISQFCIITDVERQVKMSIISRSLVPNISIIDPQLLRTKNRMLILNSAIDALSHAVESHVSKLASAFTYVHTLKAIELIIGNIREAADSKDPAALENLSIASTHAGMAFSNAGLGVLHAMAHALGGLYDMQHGQVHPVLLPSVMRFNLPACEERMGVVGRLMGGPRLCSDAYAARAGIEKLGELFEELGVTTKMRDLVPDKTNLEKVCKVATHDACHITNPRCADWRDLMAICDEAW